MRGRCDCEGKLKFAGAVLRGLQIDLRPGGVGHRPLRGPAPAGLRREPVEGARRREGRPHQDPRRQAAHGRCSRRRQAQAQRSASRRGRAISPSPEARRRSPSMRASAAALSAEFVTPGANEGAVIDDSGRAQFPISRGNGSPEPQGRRQRRPRWRPELLQGQRRRAAPHRLQAQAGRPPACSSPAPTRATAACRSPRRASGADLRRERQALIGDSARRADQRWLHGAQRRSSAPTASTPATRSAARGRRRHPVVARLSAPERRTQLLDATKAIVDADGFHAVSIEAVARAAGHHAPDRLPPLPQGPRAAARRAARA